MAIDFPSEKKVTVTGGTTTSTEISFDACPATATRIGVTVKATDTVNRTIASPIDSLIIKAGGQNTEIVRITGAQLDLINQLNQPNRDSGKALASWDLDLSPNWSIDSDEIPEVGGIPPGNSISVEIMWNTTEAGFFGETESTDTAEVTVAVEYANDLQPQFVRRLISHNFSVGSSVLSVVNSFNLISDPTLLRGVILDFSGSAKLSEVDEIKIISAGDSLVTASYSSLEGDLYKLGLTGTSIVPRKLSRIYKTNQATAQITYASKTLTAGPFAILTDEALVWGS